MSNPDQNQQISGAITFPDQGEVNRNVPQPRQPHNLQGLLRFAMDATRSEDAPSDVQMSPIDEERRKFLEEALKSMTVNVIEQLQKSVALLQNANSLSVDSDPTDYSNAFDNILEYVDTIDTANDFHKIGGFVIFKPCFNSTHDCLRASACDLLAELCQNNPYCQKVVTDNAMLPQLLNILDTDANEKVCIKALYAISCNVRENEEGYEQFLKFDGVSIMLRALQKPIDKLRTKAAFLLSCLSTTHGDMKDILCSFDTIPLLISLVSQDRMPSHEHILSLLISLVTDNPDAISQCQNPRYNFKNVIREYYREVKNKTECQEESEYCQLLLNTILKSESVEADR